MTSLTRGLGIVVPDDPLALAPNSSGIHHGFGHTVRAIPPNTVPYEALRIPVPRLCHDSIVCRTSKKISVVDPLMRTFSHHSAAPMLLYAVLELAKKGFLRHLAALRYVAIRGK
jgi:hypothetical protein